MRAASSFIVPLGALLACAAVAGAQPANDNCASPAAIGAVPFTEPGLDTTTATTEAGDPEQTCDPGYQDSNSVWYSITPAFTGILKASTGGSDYDTLLSAYTGTCGALTSVACNDDSGSLSTSNISFAVTAGTTYLIEVTSYLPDGGTLMLNVFVPTPFTNDNCGNATVIGSLPYYEPGLDTTTATTEVSDPVQTCTDDQNLNSVWYSITPGFTGAIRVTTAGSDYDTVLTAHTGACGALTEVTCNDESSTDSTSEVEFAVTAGTTYLIEATGYSGGDGGGNLVLSASMVPPPANDNCASPTAIGAVPFAEELDTLGATTEVSDPVNSCSGSTGNRSVWYSVTPTFSGKLGVSTQGSDYDTVVSVYTGTCGALTEVACDNDSGYQNTSIVNFDVTSGTTYLIRVSNLSDLVGSLFIRVDKPTDWVIRPVRPVKVDIPSGKIVGGHFATLKRFKVKVLNANGSDAREVQLNVDSFCDGVSVVSVNFYLPNNLATLSPGDSSTATVTLYALYDPSNQSRVSPTRCYLRAYLGPVTDVPGGNMTNDREMISVDVFSLP